MQKELSAPLTELFKLNRMFARSFLFVALILLSACATKKGQSTSTNLSDNKPQSQCEMLAQTTIQNDDVYFAYAKAASYEQAVTDALSNIANQRQIDIQAESLSYTTKDDVDISNTFTRRVQGISNFLFNDYEIRCHDIVSNEVLVAFDDRALTARVEALLSTFYASRGWKLRGASYLLNTTGLKPVQTHHGYDAVELPTRVTRNSKGWVLVMGPHRMQLRNDEWRLLYTLPSADNNIYTIGIENEVGEVIAHSLYHEQEFRFFVTGNFPPRYYFNLYYIDALGQVIELRSNELSIQKARLVSPIKGVFSATLPAEVDVAIEDFVLIIAEQNITRPNSKWLFQGWLDFFQQHASQGLRLTVR